MIEKGIVTEISDKRIKLSFIDQENCVTCGNKFCTIKNKHFFASNPTNLPLDLGDTVEVKVETGSAVSASFLVLIFPLILFVVFFLLSGELFHIRGEGLRALFGVAGLGAGFLVSFLLGKGKKNRLPEIIGRI